MELTVTNDAANWYKTELDLEDNAYVRFFVRYGGVGGQLPSFSLGLAIESPTEEHVIVTEENIHFYIEEADVWYFDGKNVHISYDEKMDEPKIVYQS